MGMTGIFTKALDDAMLAREIDIAVHSFKDVPTDLPNGIVQAAVLKRHKTADVLVYKNTPSKKMRIIATGSLRRKTQWLYRYPKDTVVDLRGNINTRLQKLKDNHWDGAIFAQAGLERIGLLNGKNYDVLDWMIPAPAQGGMVWVSGHLLASAVSEAGGLGLLGAGSMYPDILKAHIHKCKATTKKPFGVNVPLLYPQMDEIIEVILSEKVPIVFTSAGNPSTWTHTLKKSGVKVAHVVSSLKFAIKAELAGVDAIVAEGFEAGGHNGREENTTLTLLSLLDKKIKTPIIAAGGIATGKAMLAAKILGAEGVQFLQGRFYETDDNDGAVGNELYVSVNGDNFINAPTTIAGRDPSYRKYNLNTHYTVANVPDGLTLELRRNNATKGNPIVVFTGKATAHAKANSVNNITITLKSAILQNGSDLSAVPSKTKDDIKIDFDIIIIGIRAGKYVDDGYVFKEQQTSIGNGKFTNATPDQSYFMGVQGNDDNTYVNLQFSKELVKPINKGTHFTVGGLPNGLNLRFERTKKGKNIRFWFTGAAVNHANSDDTSFTITFDKSIFAAANRPAKNEDIIGRVQTFKIDFVD
uniref:Porphobilinogen deaminase n=1 Tax=Stylophora pistillata TaxID=50429 RepID=A0A2B4RDY1_STYPI